jgi:hypothetical protein
MPDPRLTVIVSNGALSFAEACELANHDVFTWDPDQVVGLLFKNGVKASTLDIDSSTGAITLGSPVGVNTGDHIEVRFIFIDRLSNPWASKAVLTRSSFFDVPEGNTSFSFDAQNNPMPVPVMAFAFGWDANNKFKVGFSVSDDGGAAEDLKCITRMPCGVLESYTIIDLDSSNTQTHVSTFKRTDVSACFEMEFLLRTGASSTRQEESAKLVFCEVDEIGAWPGNFPSSDVMLEQDLPQGAAAFRWSRPS